MPEQTSIGIKIPTKVIGAWMPWGVAALFGVTVGGSGAEFLDVLGAKEWKESQQEELRQAEKNREIIIALRAQNAQLLSLVGERFECDP